MKFGIYKHFKGRKYHVLHVAEHTETGEKMVVYRAMYGDGKLYCRHYDMFNEMVTRDGKTFDRFELIAEV